MDTHAGTVWVYPSPMRVLLVALVLALQACGGGGGGGTTPVPDTAIPDSAAPPASVSVREMTTGLANPWSLAFLPDGRMLVTERPGTLKLLSPSGSVEGNISGVPAVVAEGQGGLLDVALDPAFASNRRIYLSYAERDPANPAFNGTAVARAELDVATLSLSSVTVIYRQRPKVASSAHFGSRLAFDRTGALFVTTGERLLGSERGFAQDLTRGHGKIVRITTDGAPAPGNPVWTVAGALPEISASAIATRRAPHCIPTPASCGSASTARRAATRSTACWQGATTAGRWPASVRNTKPRRRSGRRRCQGWSHPVGVGNDHRRAFRRQRP